MKTTSLALSQELKKIGYPQKGVMRWIEFKKDKFDLYDGHTFPARWSGRSCVSPTADELTEVLPDLIKISRNWESRNKSGLVYHISYFIHRLAGFANQEHFEEDENLCDALAKMVIYLHRKGLLKFDTTTT